MYMYGLINYDNSKQVFIDHTVIQNSLWGQNMIEYVISKIMMTSSNGNIFCVTGHLCGEFTGPRLIPHTKASDTELWCFFDLRLNKWLSKQSWGWWLEMLSRPLQCHRNDVGHFVELLWSPSSYCSVMAPEGRGWQVCLNQIHPEEYI